MENEKLVAESVLVELPQKQKKSNQDRLCIDVLEWFLDSKRPLDESCQDGGEQLNIIQGF